MGRRALNFYLEVGSSGSSVAMSAVRFLKLSGETIDCALEHAAGSKLQQKTCFREFSYSFPQCSHHFSIIFHHISSYFITIEVWEALS